jgi:UDP-N-acetylglucosamine--N-acetylmuramyl-(pentapeptide) pyrophosphoryl-undecaprenol N-acetylglucosamine transferase
VIAAGGTGGHILPGLAVARELASRGAEVTFVGTERGLEKRLVPEAGFTLELVSSGPLKSVGLLTKLRSAIAVPMGAMQARKLLRQLRVNVVLGVGGYASGPVLLAAKSLGIPTMLLEPNAAPGMANRSAAKWVQAAAINFPEASKYFSHAQVTGIPVRPEFLNIPPIQGSPNQGPPHLLVFGGSQGARVLNHRMPEIARALIDAVPGLTILHQTGIIHERSTQMLYAQRNMKSERVRVRAFVDDMASQFQQASLVLCRSGASTVAELAVAGRPALLVPFPAATDDHQLMNARSFAKAGAALLMEERYVSSPLLQETLTELLSDPARLATMGEAARTQAHPDAAKKIADMLEKIAS